MVPSKRFVLLLKSNVQNIQGYLMLKAYQKEWLYAIQKRRLFIFLISTKVFT